MFCKALKNTAARAVRVFLKAGVLAGGLCLSAVGCGGSNSCVVDKSDVSQVEQSYALDQDTTEYIEETYYGLKPNGNAECNGFVLVESDDFL